MGIFWGICLIQNISFCGHNSLAVSAHVLGQGDLGRAGERGAEAGCDVYKRAAGAELSTVTGKDEQEQHLPGKGEQVPEVNLVGKSSAFTR